MKKLLLLPVLALLITSCGPKEIEPGMTTEAKYKHLCSSCHESGHGGAPITFRADEWAPKIAKGMDVMLKNVKEGIGRMPAGGRCVNCTDEDYVDMIKYMSRPNL